MRLTPAALLAVRARMLLRRRRVSRGRSSSEQIPDYRVRAYTHQERTVQSIVDSDAIVSQVGLNERKGTCIPSIAPRPSTLTIYLSEGWKKG
jgi:hypothetical protein